MSFDKSTVGYALGFALTICLVGSVMVSTAAISLRPMQEENRRIARQVDILRVAGVYEPGIDVVRAFEERIDARVIDFETGDFADDIDPMSFEPANDEQIRLASREDIAGIKTRPRHGLVYIVRDEDGNAVNYVFPVHGYGLWSTMYALLALESDGNTVSAIRYYDHGETPGLGGEISNPRWMARWEGKEIYDDDGNVALHVARGSAGDDVHAIDGISGATLTNNGVSNTIRYWFSEAGYKQFIDRATRG